MTCHCHVTSDVMIVIACSYDRVFWNSVFCSSLELIRIKKVRQNGGSFTVQELTLWKKKVT